MPHGEIAHISAPLVTTCSLLLGLPDADADGFEAAVAEAYARRIAEHQAGKEAHHGH